MGEADISDQIIVFFADDDLDDQDFFRKALSRVDQSIHLITAINGEETLAKLFLFFNRIPDLIFLDVNMPRKSGLECLNEIKKNSRFEHIPVVMYSTSFQEKDIREIKFYGALDFFKKPTSLSELENYLRSVLMDLKPKAESLKPKTEIKLNA
jgi:DNA-binding response OmpR family regulator